MIYGEEGFIPYATKVLKIVQAFDGDIDLSDIENENWYCNGKKLGMEDIRMQLDNFTKIFRTKIPNYQHTITQNEDFFWTYLINDNQVFVTHNRNDLIGILEVLVFGYKNT